MKTVQLIVECPDDTDRDEWLGRLGVVKYRLPMIHSYVIEIPEAKVNQLSGIRGIKTIHRTAVITAQMNTARKSVQADKVHNRGFNGRGVTIAILDTGVSPVDDFTKPKNRIVAWKDIVNGRDSCYDDNGHGTHVAGIAAGNGTRSGGKYTGIAPVCSIAAIKVLDAAGAGNSADVLAGIQWMIDHREIYQIRVANLSVGTTDIGDKDPLVRAVEAAWDAGIAMVIAAGNNGPLPGSVTSPGVSRKVITVGASDDNNLVQIWNDKLVNFSGRGPTTQCVFKPDIVAPGASITSCLTSTPTQDSKKKKNGSIVAEHYMQLSGTSMSTPIVTGAIALLLEKHPELTPNEIKLLLKKTAVDLHYPQNQQGWGLLDISKLVLGEDNHAESHDA